MREMFKVNNEDTELPWIKINKNTRTPKKGELVLVSLFLTDLTYCSAVSIVDFEQVDAG